MKRSLIMPFLLGLIAIALGPFNSNAQNITTVVGVGNGDDSLATKAEVFGPVAVTRDVAGNTYIAESGGARIRKISTTGVITTFAGNGVFGNAGDGGPATAANIGTCYGITFDKHGNFYIADQTFDIIRKVTPAGIISTIAGTTTGYSGDGGPATAAQLNTPIDIVIDTNDNIYFTDWQNYVVRKINSAGIITTVVGDGSTGSTGNGGPATASELGAPFRVTMDNKGNLYVAEVIFQCIVKVDTAGILTIIADSTGTYAIGPDGDGGPAMDATMTSPCGLAVDTSGHLYFSDIGNGRIRMVDLNTGLISNYAASGIAGYSGDGGPATAAQISTPEGLACDAAGNLYICDADNNRLRKVTASTGVMSTFAGQNGMFGDGVAASSEISTPSNIATDAAGNIYIADFENNRIRKVTVSTGMISTVAGSGIAGYQNGFSGDGGPATAATIYGPNAVAVDNAGNMYISDGNNQRIRKVNAAGIITTIAGTGTNGYSGDGGPATAAKIYAPAGLAADNAGNVYFADQGNSRIRKISAAGTITTVAGTGTAGFSGDGAPATIAKIRFPSDVALDGMGNLYIADAYNNRVRKVDTLGLISTVVGTGIAGFAGDGGPANVALINIPSGIKADSVGNLFISDGINQRIRQINVSTGTISTLAGNGTAGFSGDGGPAIAAKLNYPSGVAPDLFGNLYIADGSNFRVRKVNLTLAVPDLNGRNILSDANVFPNPATTEITISNAPNSTVTLFDMSGRQVKKAGIRSSKETININDLPAGIYLVHVAGEHGSKKNIKIVKE